MAKAKTVNFNPTVIPFPQAQARTKCEMDLERYAYALADTMEELFLVAELTGRHGLMQRVCLSLLDVLMASKRLAQEKVERGSHAKTN